MNILLLCDDYWHPGEVPENGVKPLIAKGYEFDIVKDGGEIAPAMFGGYQVVMLCKSDEKAQTDKEPWITDEIRDALTNHVESGGGLLAVHSGTVLAETDGKLKKLIGCRFKYHPASSPVEVATILPHPVTEGVGFFCEVDEHYRLEITSSDVVAVMASRSAAQGEESKYEEDPFNNTAAWISPAALVRTQGKGRVCALTPGHFLHVWQNAQYQKVLENALNWCAGRQS